MPSRWSFARRHMLDTGELMWTPMSRVVTRGIRPTAGAVENMRRLGLVRPRDLVPSPSLGGPPAAGRQRIFVGASSLCRDGAWSLAIAGASGTGACSRLSPPVLGPRGGRGHTCRTPPRACSVSNATSLSVSAWLARTLRTRCNRGCGTCGVGRFVHWGPPCSDDSVSTVR